MKILTLKKQQTILKVIVLLLYKSIADRKIFQLQHMLMFKKKNLNSESKNNRYGELT